MYLSDVTHPVLQGSHGRVHAQGSRGGTRHHELLCHWAGPARGLLCPGTDPTLALLLFVMLLCVPPAIGTCCL